MVDTREKWVAVARRSTPVFVVVLVVLSTLPGGLRPHTGAPGNLEHFLAYAGTGASMWFAVRSRRLLVVVATLCLLSGALEIAQIWIPGRSAGVDNWLASTAGGFCGGLAALACSAMLRRR